jgi:hypothetical protein
VHDAGEFFVGVDGAVGGVFVFEGGVGVDCCFCGVVSMFSRSGVRGGKVTLLLGLVFLLVRGEEHVVGESSPSDCPLGSHGVTLASERAGTADSLLDEDAALAFDIDGTFGHCVSRCFGNS